MTGVSRAEVESDAFKALYTSSLAVILDLPVSAVVIIGIVEIQVRRGLGEGDSKSGIRIIIPGFRVTYTVTARYTTVAELSSALRAASAPLRAVLVSKGYTSVFLGTPESQYYFLPTTQPSIGPPHTQNIKPSNWTYIILIVVVTFAIAISVIVATFWYTKPVLRETLLTKCLASLTFCTSFSPRAFFTRR